MNSVKQKFGRRAAMTAAGLMLAGAAAQPADAALVFDVRATGVFSGVATVSSDGKVVAASPDSVINYGVFAQVTGAEGNTALEGFQQASGTIASSTGGQRVNLTHGLNPPFNGSSSLPGDPTDLGSDGDIDIGGSLTPANNTTGRITYRSNAIQLGNATGVSEFLLGVGTITAGAFDQAGTLVNFIVGTPAGANLSPSWQEDGTSRNANTGMVIIGAPVQVNVPEPTALGVLAVGAAGLIARRGRRSR